MKLIGFTCTYNEAEMVQYVMPYVELMGYDKFIVFDNQSTDNTVELLSKYPFVEVREWDTNGKFSDLEKRNKELDAYLECWKIYDETLQDVWMTFTDFDEVIYMLRERERTFKEYLEWLTMKGYNYYDGRMLHLTWNGDISKKALPHKMNGVRGSWWFSEGSKPLLVKVNAFGYMNCYAGNHTMEVSPIDGVEPRNLDDTGEICSFHLKYFDRGVLERKKNSYVSTDAQHLITQDATTAFELVRDASFPLEQYYLMKGFFVKKMDCLGPYSEGLRFL